jgi:hypothetical protein
MIRLLTIAFSLAALAVSASPASAGLLSSPLGMSVPATTVHESGFIMRDGGICDPIRHMGC